MDRRHWIAVPLDVGEGPIDCQIDISQSYDCDSRPCNAGRRPERDRRLYRPLSTRLSGRR